MSAADNETRSVFEGEAFAALHRLAGHLGAASHSIIEAVHALELAGLDDLARQLHKAEELHRLAAARIASIARQLGEGRDELV
jgi:hypothetical protein